MTRIWSHWAALLLTAVLSFASVGQDWTVDAFRSHHNAPVSGDADRLAPWSLRADAQGLDRPVLNPLLSGNYSTVSKYGPDPASSAILPSGCHYLANSSRRTGYQKQVDLSLSSVDLVFPFHTFW